MCHRGGRGRKVTGRGGREGDGTRASGGSSEMVDAGCALGVVVWGVSGGKSEREILMGVYVESNEPVVVERGGGRDRGLIYGKI